jgi:hypothetical protein
MPILLSLQVERIAFDTRALAIRDGCQDGYVHFRVTDDYDNRHVALIQSESVRMNRSR